METLAVGPTYENGKAMGRFDAPVDIVDQLGAADARDDFLSEIKRVSRRFTVAAAAVRLRRRLDALRATPPATAPTTSSTTTTSTRATPDERRDGGSDDPAWAAEEQWGGMVNLLIKDANNWDRADTRFRRSHLRPVRGPLVGGW